MTTALDRAGEDVSALLAGHLHPAVLDVLAEWDTSSMREASVENAARRLTLLSDAVRGVSIGNLGDAEALPRSDLARQLLTLLRRSFLRRLQLIHPSPPAGAILSALAAFEQVSKVVEPEGRGKSLAETLSGPDGAELLVEVAHDLRSPLTAILFLAETLLRGRSGPITSVQERQLGLIYSAAFGLSTVASDVLELVRGSERLLDLEPAPFSISETLEQLRDIVLPMAEEKGLELLFEVTEHDSRHGQQVAISRVLLNLLVNAIKFTNAGQVSLHVKEIDARRVEFSVRDTGRGIPPAAMAMLFEPFRRRPDVRHKFAFSGAGLGLSICRKFVEAMGSTLEVETAPNQGTRFYFRLDLPPSDARLLV